ncbi:dihydrofolate reductase [Prorops nasuta]|uniref:dihydrofolate reductase n=1 Tax=Prorops nasuta TaxID=863751 RepID=UPI0034CE5452
MHLKLNLIAAASENMGIGINGKLPWRLKSEMAYFTRLTTETKDQKKKNVVLMGRVTWECIPKRYRPLKDRINIVLTTKNLDYGDEAIVCNGLSQALDLISKGPLKDQVESIWVIGGSSVYKASMESPHFSRLYLTRIKKYFECDAFFPPLLDNLKLINDPAVPTEVQKENDIQFQYEVYEKEE